MTDRRASAWIPSVPDLVFCATALVVALGASVRLTQSDGDLFAHLTMGAQILDTWRVPTTSTLGVTTNGAPMIAPGWLSEVIFAATYRVGGLAAITALVAIVVAAAHATVAWFLRRRGVDARWTLVATLVSLALGATHWTARPHVFTLLAAALLIVLLEWDDVRAVPWIAALFAVWANLHGGWIFGVVMIAAYVAGDALEWRGHREQANERAEARTAWRTRAARHGATLVLAMAATFATPYGIYLHREVWHTLMDPSLSRFIDEYQAPAFRDPGDVAFLGALLMTVLVLARSVRRMPWPWLFVVIANVAFALRAGRNISLFGITAWPLIALFSREPVERFVARFAVFADVARRDVSARAGRWAAACAVALGALGASGGRIAGVTVIARDVDPTRFPVAAVDAMRDAQLDGRIFAPWTWGSYVAFAWPGRQAFVDPLKITPDAAASYGTIVLTRPGWREQLSRWDVAVAVLPSGSTLARALERDADWTVWHRDPNAVVIRRAHR